MKKIIKLLISSVVILALCFTVAIVPASAAADTVLKFKTSATVGDTVSVTVSLSVKNMCATDINISYDASVLTYLSGATEGGGGVVRIVDENVVGADGKTVNSKSYTLSFKAKKAGSSVISVSGLVGAGIPATDVTLRGASATLTVKDEKLSANANLSSLSVSNGSLSPRFSASTTKYTVNVKKNVTNCTVYAVTQDSAATVSVSGSSALKIGDNVRKITVTAPSGVQKVYTVTINRSNVDEETSSDSSATDEPNPLETVIDGVSYKILQKLSKVKLPTGFSAVKKVYNDETIRVAVDKNRNFELFYLKAKDAKATPYTYDEMLNIFTKVDIIEQGGRQYIVIPVPDDMEIPEGYYSSNVTINEQSIKCFASTSAELTDMYYIYCYHNGKYSMYRYDDVEGILQRSPEFRLKKSDYVETVATNTDTDGDGFWEKFMNLSSNARTILVCLAIAVVGIIVLIILLMIKSSRKRIYDNMEEVNGNSGNGFDNVKFDDDFEIISGEEDDD